MINKRKIIYLLISVVASLLLINVLLGLTTKKESKEPSSELSVLKIEEIFNITLKSYGIQEDWIKKQNLKKGTFDSISYKYRIQIPSDVSIPVILKDLNEAFANLPVTLSSNEKKSHDLTSFQIVSRNYTKMYTEFKYNPKINREYSKISFLLTDYNSASKDQIKTLTNFGTPIGILLPLEEESQQIAELIKSKSFEYYVELNNDSDKLDFELDEEFGLEKLSKNIKNIISSFNSPRIFFINNLESDFNKSTTNFITEKFAERRRRILVINDYVKLKGENEQDLKSLLSFHLNKLEFGQSKIFRIEIEDWLIIQNELNSFVKKGNIVVSPVKIL